MNTFGILVVALVAVVLGLWAVWPSRHDSEVYTHIYSFFYRTLMRGAPLPLASHAHDSPGERHPRGVRLVRPLVGEVPRRQPRAVEDALGDG